MPFPVGIQFVKRAQEKLGRRLPLSYVAQICKENGGEIPAAGDCWNLFPIFDDSDRTRLKRTCNDIVRETAAARDWPGFPASAVAIGSNGGGDLLVFLADDTDKRYADAVYWWDHETGDVNKVADDWLELQ